MRCRVKNLFTGRLGGFTLIELLVVVLIIGILAAVALPQYEKAVTKARFTEAIINLKAIKQAKDVYMLSGGDVNNPNWDELDISVPTETENFEFYDFDPWNGYCGPTAAYKKEKVCLCYYEATPNQGGCNGTLVLSQNHSDHPADRPASFDYAKLLNIPENDECACY